MGISMLRFMAALSMSSPSIPMHPDAWQALQQRDASAAGRFIFGVITTGIYCRPGCPARQPKPENVRVFATNEDARAAGFRPCLRCHPDAVPTATDRLDARQLRAVVDALDAALADGGRPDVKRLAGTIGRRRPGQPPGFRAVLRGHSGRLRSGARPRA